MPTSSENYQVILFDLGGVLVELGDTPLNSDWLSKNNKFTLKDWFHSETAIAFEKGLIAPNAFIEQFKADLSIDADSEKILEHFTDWPIGLFAGVEELLLALKKNYQLAILSNTNELHWPRITEEFKIPRYTDKLYASHILNMAKPNLDIFQYVISDLGIQPDKILFLDDNLANVEAAKTLGISGFLVSGIEQTINCLINRGVLNSE